MTINNALRRLALVALLGAFGMRPAAAGGQDTSAVGRGVRIGLTYAPGTRPGVLILPVSGANADSVGKILGRDLDWGDRLTVTGPDSGEAPTGVMNYAAFAGTGAVALVQATVTPAGSLHVVVHDVAAARVLSVADYPLSGPPLGAEWRAAVHRGSDEIERAITNTRGIASTRALFERGGQLWIIDSDGAMAHPMAGCEGALSPAWSPNGRSIAYDELANTGHHTIVVRDVLSGTVKRFATSHTLNITPTFSPDGNTIVFAAGNDGTDLYSVPAAGGASPTRIMVGQGTTNTNPTFSPDGRRIAFTSGRLAHPEVYIMDADGTNADLLTNKAFGDQLYRTAPDWSPDGRTVAFQSQISGVFQIMTIDVRDRNVVGLTSEGRNEEPSWAPDGRHLLFTSTRSGAKQLWILDVESGRLRQLTHGGSARMGAWSPRLDAVK